MNRRSRVPLSLSDLKKKREEEADRASRPLFQSRAERQRAALERLDAKRAAEKRATPLLQRPQIQVPPPKRPRTNKSHEQNGSKDRAVKEQNVRDASSRYVVSARINQERSRFRFQWDASDDTANGDDELLRALREQTPRPQFGRGKMGGMGEISHLRGRQDFRDSRHWSEKKRDEMTDRDWRIFREDYRIAIRASGAPPPHPARGWNEMGLSRGILRLVADVARYEKPSPIQMAAIPLALTKRDCIGLAETGSGKTAAFVLPMLVHISGMPRMTARIAARGPYALVLAPTRELALQIVSEARKFADPMGFRIVHIIGGQELDVQATNLQAGCEIVVCTPGRMVDLLSKQMAALGNCNYLILDEADRMIDMGFEPQLAEVLECMPHYEDGSKERRHTFMFSATMSTAVERLAKTYLREPVIISVGETGKAADNVYQRLLYFATENKRRERFIELLESVEAPILVFVNTRAGCEMVSRYVEANSAVRPVIMHSGKSQDQRENTLAGFRSGRFRVLIATDVVGRGIDIKGVRNVINFELPRTVEAYTHRIGRTGRAGEKGTAWSLATESDKDLFGPLCAMLEQCGANIPPEILKQANGKGGAGMRPITE